MDNLQMRVADTINALLAFRDGNSYISPNGMQLLRDAWFIEAFKPDGVTTAWRLTSRGEECARVVLNALSSDPQAATAVILGQATGVPPEPEEDRLGIIGFFVMLALFTLVYELLKGA